jgi:WD40 repeat protein/DNA-binding SARP family transcriptional activator
VVEERVEFSILGPLEISRDGDPVGIAAAKQRTLVGVLLLHPNEVVSRERLIDELWGERPPRTAVKALHTYVSELRKALGEGVIETRRPGYVLAVEAEQIDSTRFERLVADARRRRAEGAHVDSAEVYESALSLWRGSALAGIGFESFARNEVERLEELRLTAISERLDCELALGRHEQVIGELEALVAQHPLREQLRAQLMLALYRAGRQAEALEVYRATRELLSEELGLEPSRALQDLERSILLREEVLDTPAAIEEDKRAAVVCPFKGLAPFELEDAAYFCGRERVVSELVTMLIGSTLVGLVGPSGAGKSSILRAGLLLALAADAVPGSMRWTRFLLRPGDHPATELERVVGGGIGQALDRLAPGERLVLAVDQLEEVFSLCEDEAERQSFLASLVAAANDPDRRAVVLVSLRADYYGHCADHRALAELLRAHHLLVGPMERVELVRAIELPARRAGLEIEGSLVEALVGDVLGEPGALPLLSTALLELWRLREGCVLSFGVYRASGGVRGAVARLAEQAYGRLSGPDQDAARRILLRLAVEENGVLARRRVSVEELDTAGDPAAARALAVLTDTRLLTTTGVWVEFSHEALLREWPRLAGWFEEDREGQRLLSHLAESAREWSTRGRDRSELYRGARLAAALDWAAEHKQELNALEYEFLEQSRAQGERELAEQRRRNRRLRVALVGAAVLLLLAIAAGAAALVARSNAQDEATVALSRQLGSEAVIEPRTDRAMLLAYEAVDLNRSTATEGTLLATLLRSPAALATFPFPIQARPLALSASPDGKTLAVSDSENEIRVFDTRTRRETRPPIPNIGLGLAVPYSPDGSLLAALRPAGEPSGLALLDARSLEIVRVLPFDPLFTLNTTPLDPFGIAPDDRTVFLTFAVLNPDRSDGPAYLDLWNVAKARRTTIRLGSNGILGAEYVAAGKRIVTVTDTQIATWDARTLRPIHRIRQPVSRDAVVADVSPDGRTVAVGTSFGSVTFVDVATGRVTPGNAVHGGAVVQLLFSPDGRVAVSTGTDARIIVWDTATGQPIETLAGHGSQITGTAFSRDGRTLFTASPDGVIFEWDLGTERRFGQPFTMTSAPPRIAIDAQLSPPPLALSPDGSDFAVRAGLSSVALYSTRSLRRLRRFAVHAGGDVVGLGWSTAGELAVTGDGGRVQLWNVRARPRLVRVLRGLRSIGRLREAVTTVAFSPDGRTVAAGDIKHTPRAVPVPYGAIAVWNTSGQRLWMRTGHSRISTVVFSPDGRTIAACLSDGSVGLYDARTGHLERMLHLEGTSDLFFTTAAFTPDGKLLATGTAAGIVQLWNPATGAQIGHPTLVAAAPVASIAFGPSGGTFATAGGSDGLAKLWTTKTQQQFGATFPGDPGQWGNAQYTPDGSKLIVIYQDGTGVVWPVSLHAWEEHACQVAGRNLTREEWSRYIGNHPYSTVCPGLSVPPTGPP